MKQSVSKLSVSFGDISIQEYPVELGDHPCCSSGSPIQIGWTPLTSSTLPLETYELLRSQERRTSLQKTSVIPVQKRVEMLLEAGYSIHEIAFANMEIEFPI